MRLTFLFSALVATITFVTATPIADADLEEKKLVLARGRRSCGYGKSVDNRDAQPLWVAPDNAKWNCETFPKWVYKVSVGPHCDCRFWTNEVCYASSAFIIIPGNNGKAANTKPAVKSFRCWNV